MSKITINGVEVSGDFAGRSIVVRNGAVIVDGNVLDLPDQKVINIEIHGDVGSVEASTGDVRVAGNSGEIRTSTGDVTVGGSVTGSVNTSTGDVRCGSVGGNVRTTTGDIYK